MYTVFYKDSNNEYLKSTDVILEDTIKQQIDHIVTNLDRFIYLANMYRILEDCFLDFRSFHIEKKQEFWKSNKYLLNYVNAVYSFKEYIGKCYGNADNVYNIINKYYNNAEWFTFLCNYRNRIIHQSTVIKDYDQNGAVYVKLEDLVESTKQQMKENRKGKDNAERFIAFVEGQFSNASIMENAHYLPVMQIIELASVEIKKMSNDIFSELFSCEIQDCLESLLSMTSQDQNEGIYLDTYYIQEGTYKSIHINHLIKDYFINVLYLLGNKFDIVMYWINLYKSSGYDIMYLQGKATIDIVIQSVLYDLAKLLVCQ